MREYIKRGTVDLIRVRATHRRFLLPRIKMHCLRSMIYNVQQLPDNPDRGTVMFGGTTGRLQTEFSTTNRPAALREHHSDATTTVLTAVATKDRHRNGGVVWGPGEWDQEEFALEEIVSSNTRSSSSGSSGSTGSSSCSLPAI
uniref:Uncharacterized protein n=1 Tax=Anopheles albimanus TaxID=7167 RepID=A0A182F8B8_ANOAL